VAVRARRWSFCCATAALIAAMASTKIAGVTGVRRPLHPFAFHLCCLSYSRADSPRGITVYNAPSCKGRSGYRLSASRFVLKSRSAVRFTSRTTTQKNHRSRPGEDRGALPPKENPSMHSTCLIDRPCRRCRRAALLAGRPRMPASQKSSSTTRSRATATGQPSRISRFRPGFGELTRTIR